MDARGVGGVVESAFRGKLQHSARSWDNGCPKQLPFMPFLTPDEPRGQRDQVRFISALGLFLAVLDFTEPKTAPLPLPPQRTGCHQTASCSPKMAPLCFCTSGNELRLTEEPGLYQRPCSCSTLPLRVRGACIVWRCVIATSAASVEDDLSRLLPPAPSSFLAPSRCPFPSFIAPLQSPAAVSPAYDRPNNCLTRLPEHIC